MGRGQSAITRIKKGGHVGLKTPPISDEDRTLFEGLTSGEFDNLALLSVKLGDEDTVAIVTVEQIDGEFIVSPLFVKATEKMLSQLADPLGNLPTEVAHAID